jgi:hypothetical protein
MNHTSTLKPVKHKKAGINWKTVTIVSVSIVIIAFAIYPSVAAIKASDRMADTTAHSSMNPAVKVDTSEILVVNPELKFVYRYVSNPYQRTQAELQFAQRYGVSMWRNPELKISNNTTSDPFQRNLAELQLSRRYQTSSLVIPELQFTDPNASEPFQRTQAELQFAQRYGYGE